MPSRKSVGRPAQDSHTQEGPAKRKRRRDDGDIVSRQRIQGLPEETNAAGTAFGARSKRSSTAVNNDRALIKQKTHSTAEIVESIDVLRDLIEDSQNNTANTLANTLEQLKKNGLVHRHDFHLQDKASSLNIYNACDVAPIEVMDEMMDKLLDLRDESSFITTNSFDALTQLRHVRTAQDTSMDVVRAIAEQVEDLEKKYDETLEAKLEEHLEDKLEEKLEEKLEDKLEEKLEKKLEQKLDEKFTETADRIDGLTDVHLEGEAKIDVSISQLGVQIEMANERIESLTTAFRSAKANTDMKLEQILAAVQSLAQKQ